MAVPPTVPASTGRLSASDPAHVAALRKQAQGLEGVFLNTLMSEMFSSVKSDSALGGGGFSEQTWRSMQAEQYADSIAQAGGIGLADQIVSNLLQVQESSQPSR